MFVERNQDGTIKGVYAMPQPGLAEEELPDDHPSVIAYLAPPKKAAMTLSEFKARLTTGEKAALAALWASASTLAAADKVLMFEFATAHSLAYSDPKYQAGLDRLQALGVLTAQRRTELGQP